MGWFIFSEEEKSAKQQITDAFVEKQMVIFLKMPRDKAGGYHGGAEFVMAPTICIKNLIDVIEKKEEGVVDCPESSSPFNYAGAKIKGDTVYLNKESVGGKFTVEEISVSSLRKLASDIQ